MRHYYVANVAFRGILTTLVECDKIDTAMSLFPAARTACGARRDMSHFFM
jgi:hypothetical protein